MPSRERAGINPAPTVGVHGRRPRNTGDLRGNPMALKTTSPNSVRAVATPAIREDVLRDPRYPVHRIADRLLPYLRVLVEQFQAQQVILFGAYAYGQPDESSDVDLLVVKDLEESVLKDKVHIRRAWWKMPRREPLLPFDLILVSPQRHRERLENAGGCYDEIVRKGLKLA